jgi:hypothetical protein
MATRKIPAATKAGGGKVAAAPKEGAKPTTKKRAASAPAAAAPAAKVPAGKVPSAKPAAVKSTVVRPRKAVAKAPAPPESDRILMVAEAAYYRAERRGFAPGSEMEDWLAAEEEIARLLAGR